ncbi:hypothetical protein CkaCkLH20_08237 [Colletotrichum karsti]|uniref:Uncharacterized protein n=1 Tax=Colletotrichum karsti TaxID=1095194 RepID=A0A9P6I1B7_9PEZI|nr:uncharacterized protein CkaCkLH20_08237 [Colletotrichum karsti]KAF9874254.1 hypothetical protein CkaCkLH20_08237 [Colletotrichum karsti]
MTLVMPRGPKMIEAICPGCFKSFTKIGSMHRHIYEDRCRSPVPRFVKKIKAEHGARVAAAAARSAARAAARGASAATPDPVDPRRPEQSSSPSDQGDSQQEIDQLQQSFKVEDGTGFAQMSGFEQVCLSIVTKPHDPLY